MEEPREMYIAELDQRRLPAVAEAPDAELANIYATRDELDSARRRYAEACAGKAARLTRKQFPTGKTLTFGVTSDGGDDDLTILEVRDHLDDLLWSDDTSGGPDYPKIFLSDTGDVWLLMSFIHDHGHHGVLGSPDTEPEGFEGDTFTLDLHEAARWATTRRILDRQRSLNRHHGRLLRDAVATLAKSLGDGRRPWLNYDSDLTDPLSSEAGYRLLLKQVEKGLRFWDLFGGYATITPGPVALTQVWDLNMIVQLLRDVHGIADARIEPDGRGFIKIVAGATAAAPGWYDGDGDTDPVADAEDFFIGVNGDGFLSSSDPGFGATEDAIAREIAAHELGEEYLRGKHAIGFIFTGKDKTVHEVRLGLPHDKYGLSFKQLHSLAFEQCRADKGDRWIDTLVDHRLIG